MEPIGLDGLTWYGKEREEKKIIDEFSPFQWSEHGLELFLLSRKHNDLFILCRIPKQTRSWFAVSSFLGLLLGKNTGSVHRLWPVWLMATWHSEVLGLPSWVWVGQPTRAKLSSHTTTVGWGCLGWGTSCPQLSPHQEEGRSKDEADSVAGVLEIKVILMMMIVNLLST